MREPMTRSWCPCVGHGVLSLSQGEGRRTHPYIGGGTLSCLGGDSRQKVATVAAAPCAMLAESCAILLMLFAIAALPRSSEATQKLARRSADRITAGNRVLV